MKKYLLVLAIIPAVLAAVSVRGGARSTMLLNPAHDCAYCHLVHAGVAAGEFPLGIQDSITTACLSCHAVGAAGSALKADVHVYDDSKCQDCHVAHSNVQNWLGGTNLKLVRDEVLEPANHQNPDNGWQNAPYRPVVFESRGFYLGDPTLHSFCDANEDSTADATISVADTTWDGVCDTCHWTIGRHLYPDEKEHGHRTGETCTRCHCHETGFLRNPPCVNVP